MMALLWLVAAGLCAAEPPARVAVDGEVRALAYSADGRHLAARIAGPSGELLSILAAPAGKTKLSIGVDPIPGPATVAFTPNGRFAAAGYAFGVRLWAVNTGRLIRTLAADSPGTTLALSADARRAAAAGEGAAALWDITEPRLLRRLGRWKGGGARAVAFSPDGRLLAVAGRAEGRARVELFDADSGSATARASELPDAEFLAAAWSPDGSLLALGGYEGADPERPIVALVSAELRPLRKLQPETGARVVALSFSPDGAALLVAVSSASAAGLWDPSTGKLLRRLEGVPVGEEAGAAIAPDGRTAAVGGRGEIRFWSLSK